MDTELDSIPTLPKGEIFLTFGLVAFVFALALTHFVMGFFLAVIPGALALIFLSAGFLRARNRADIGDKRAVGMLLLFAGFCVLVVVSFYAAGLSYREAFASLRPNFPPPSAGEWGGTILSWFLSVAFVAPGLACWTNWRPQRRLFWCIIAFLIPASVFLMHQGLVKMGWSITS